jgi:hypothetical protein
MLPVPFEIVPPPPAVNALFPAFLQVLKAAGECLFRNACELHRRSRLNSIDSHVAVILAFFFQSWKQKKKKIAGREIRGVRGMWKHSNVVFSEKS